LESTIEDANVWVNVLDERKNVVIWNKAAETISGYSREEVVGHGKIWEWLYPDQQYRNEVTDSVTEILQHGRVEQDVETSIRRKDGEIRVISWNERNLLGEHGEVIGSIAIGQDVTERKRAEEALRESEEKYRMIFQNSPLGIFRSTLDGRFLEVNPSLSKILGYDSPETVIREIHDIAKQIYVRPEDRHRIVAEQLGSDDVTHDLNSYRRKDGSEFFANLYLKTVRDAEGQPVFLEGIVEDITERKRMQEELENYSKQLQESQEKLRALHQHASQLGSASNIDEMVKSTLDAIEFALGFDVADVYIAAGDSLRVKGVRGASTGVPEERLSGRGLVAKAARTQATLRVSDTTKEPDYVDRKGWDWTGPHTMLSELAVPVVVDGQTVAVLNAESIRPDAFSGEDQRLLETLVAHVGSAMQRQKHAQELETYSKHLEELVEERTEKLRQSEERYRSIIQNVPGMVWTSCEKGDTVFITPNVKELCGYTPEEIYADGEQAWSKHVHPDDRAKVNEAYKRLFSDGSVFDVEYRYQRPDGKLFWLNDRADLVYEKDGVRYTDGVTTDITERKRIEEALRANEQRYRRLFESSPVSLWEEDFSEVKKYFDDLRSRGIKDLRRHLMEHPEDVAECASMAKVVDVNEATLELYGAKSVEELRGGLQEVLSLESQAQFHFREELVALGEGRTRFTSEFENQTLTGETKHVSLILNVVPGYEDTLEKVLVSIIDLTERRKMEDQVRESRDQLEQVLATNPAVLYFEEPLPDFSDTYSTFVSESARFVLGFEPKKFLGESGLSFWRSRIQPDDLTRYWAELPSLWRDGHHTFEYRFLHSDGTYRWITEQYRVFRDAEGRISHVVSVAIDVTGRKQLEEKLARAERLATIGETAAKVGHDLRNPLQAITGALHLLRKESLTEKEKDEMLQLIQNSVHYSDAIVRDLTEYSTEIHLEPIETTPKSIITDAVRTVRLPEKITLHELSQEHPIIMVDLDRMRRVIVNIIENAIDAMPQGGTLTISSEQFNGNVEIDVSDTGPGMPEKIMQNLWKPFQTTKAKGLGLGLAICKRIVDAHGGTISMNSKAGEGVTVTIRLPLNVHVPEVNKK
jgi:PAS domain S-box-containing protein